MEQYDIDKIDSIRKLYKDFSTDISDSANINSQSSFIQWVIKDFSSLLDTLEGYCVYEDYYTPTNEISPIINVTPKTQYTYEELLMMNLKLINSISSITSK